VTWLVVRVTKIVARHPGSPASAALEAPLELTISASALASLRLPRRRSAAPASLRTAAALDAGRQEDASG
jgi:hypothetical protein